MSADVILEKKGRAGVITLNRPDALNALNHKMVKATAAALDDWEHDEDVAHVIVRGAGNKAFCAGGDIRGLYEAWLAADIDALTGFFRDEYLLNARIKAYPKPYIALINGIVMGGGVGVSVHGSHRIGTENTQFSMPETGIGFFPDVGGTYFLPRMPNKTGVYCALSAGRLKQGDALETGVLTHAVSEANLPEVAHALEAAEEIETALAPFLMRPQTGPVTQNADLIAACFGEQSVADILKRLEAANDPFAVGTAQSIRRNCPASLLIAFEQMQRGSALDFNACMTLEFRIVSRVLEGSDFFEGIRSVVVDKDNAPKWKPARLEDVDRDEMASYFQTARGGDLPL